MLIGFLRESNVILNPSLFVLKALLRPEYTVNLLKRSPIEGGPRNNWMLSLRFQLKGSIRRTIEVPELAKTFASRLSVPIPTFLLELEAWSLLYCWHGKQDLLISRTDKIDCSIGHLHCRLYPTDRSDLKQRWVGAWTVDAICRQDD